MDITKNIAIDEHYTITSSSADSEFLKGAIVGSIVTSRGNQIKVRVPTPSTPRTITVTRFIREKSRIITLADQNLIPSDVLINRIKARNEKIPIDQTINYSLFESKKKVLGVQTATVFRDATQIAVDRRIYSQKKELRIDLKTQVLKTDAIQKKLDYTLNKLSNSEVKLKGRETRIEQGNQKIILIRSELKSAYSKIRQLKRALDMAKNASTIANRKLDFITGESLKIRQSNDILQKALQREQMTIMQEKRKNIQYVSNQTKLELAGRSMSQENPIPIGNTIGFEPVPEKPGATQHKQNFIFKASQRARAH